MTIKAKRDNEARRLTASLLNALAIAGVAGALFAPFGVGDAQSSVEILVRGAYLLIGVYLHLCGQAAIKRLEDEKD